VKLPPEPVTGPALFRPDRAAPLQLHQEIDGAIDAGRAAARIGERPIDPLDGAVLKALGRRAHASVGLALGGKALAAEPPPEITTIRFEKDPGACIDPQVFEELLHAEGFTDIRYVDLTEARIPRADAEKLGFISSMITHGEVDFARDFAPNLVLTINAVAPVTVLSGVHLGCFEIFGKREIHTIGDLKGRTVGDNASAGASDRPLLTIMTGLVGLDPAKNLHWVADPSLRPLDLFIEGKVDAFFIQ
jgi:NitT/TauT family transport system substrate-binding protein